MEELLHYVWKHKIFPLHELKTTAGQTVEVIDAGLHNSNAGPDFFNAKLKIDGVLWVGNVEVHLRSSDWTRHHHHTDEAYNNVVLHVVAEADADAVCADGRAVPQLLLPVPAEVAARYAELCRADAAPPCQSVLRQLPKLTVHSWLSALQVERLEQKAALIVGRLAQCNHNWEDVFFITLARNFGFGVNGDAFEAWALHLPFRAADKHRDNLFQLEALFFGIAGLLDAPPPDDYADRLQHEFHYLRHKFSLPAPLPASVWRFLRLRPDNFPHVRIAQLASLYHHTRSLLSQAMEASTLEEVRKLFAASTSPYWEGHYRFGIPSPRRVKQVGQSALMLVVLNTVVPLPLCLRPPQGQRGAVRARLALPRAASGREQPHHPPLVCRRHCHRFGRRLASARAAPAALLRP